MYVHKYIALDTFANIFEKRSYKYPSRDKLGLFVSLMRQEATTAENP